MNTSFLLRKIPCNQTLGMEIECLVPSSIYMDKSYTYHKFWYCATDGSIRRDGFWNHEGMEFVSQPMPPRMLKRAITTLYKDIGQWRENHTCGIHIHVNRQWLSKRKAEAIATFINALPLDQYQDFFGRLPNEYCRQGTGDRYVTVNITNENTVEFRMFRSGYAKWARYCVDMACYLIENAYRLNVDAMYAFKDMERD